MKNRFFIFFLFSDEIMANVGQKKLSFLDQPLVIWRQDYSEPVNKVIIFLHGSGGSGLEISQYLENLGAKVRF